MTTGSCDDPLCTNLFILTSVLFLQDLLPSLLIVATLVKIRALTLAATSGLLFKVLIGYCTSSNSLYRTLQNKSS